LMQVRMAGIRETWQNIFPCRRGFGRSLQL
jgi:hypothetical protein